MRRRNGGKVGRKRYVGWRVVVGRVGRLHDVGRMGRIDTDGGRRCYLGVCVVGVVVVVVSGRRRRACVIHVRGRVLLVVVVDVMRVMGVMGGMVGGGSGNEGVGGIGVDFGGGLEALTFGDAFESQKVLLSVASDLDGGLGEDEPLNGLPIATVQF